MVGKISDDKKRDREEENTSFFHLRIWTERKCLSNQFKSQTQNKCNAVTLYFCLHNTTYYNFTMKMFVEPFNMGKFNNNVLSPDIQKCQLIYVNIF